MRSNAERYLYTLRHQTRSKSKHNYNSSCSSSTTALDAASAACDATELALSVAADAADLTDSVACSAPDLADSATFSAPSLTDSVAALACSASFLGGLLSGVLEDSLGLVGAVLLDEGDQVLNGSRARIVDG